MPLKIMVVDAEPASATLIRSLSAPLGHTVLTFDKYDAAAQRAEIQRFDLVFAAMRTAHSGELEFIARLRDSQLSRGATIVMLSPNEDLPSWRKAFSEGADFILTTPLVGERMRRMLAAIDSLEWKNRSAARMPLVTEVVCTWDGRPFPLRSRNISESGMLLEPAIDGDVGQEVALDFKMPETGASLSLRARIVRKEGADRMAVAFQDIAPEHRNAIQLYVLGRLKDLTPARDLAGIGLRRVFRD